MDKKEINKLYDMIQLKLSDEILKEDKYKEIQGRCSIANEILQNSLTQDEFSLYEDAMDIYAELMDFETEQGFIKGFTMANKLRDESLER